MGALLRARDGVEEMEDEVEQDTSDNIVAQLKRATISTLTLKDKRKRLKLVGESFCIVKAMRPFFVHRPFKGSFPIKSSSIKEIKILLNLNENVGQISIYKA